MALIGYKPRAEVPPHQMPNRGLQAFGFWERPSEMERVTGCRCGWWVVGVVRTGVVWLLLLTDATAVCCVCCDDLLQVTGHRGKVP